jgi:hypothetical protein
VNAAAQIAAIATAVTAGVAAAFGAWRWYRVDPPGAFWPLARLAQAAAAAQALVAGALAVAGFDPGDGLYWLYALLPVAVSFVAEQRRLASAQTVLDARGLENARAMERLDDAGRRSVVRAIVRREMGVVSIGLGVVVFLALRALATI